MEQMRPSSPQKAPDPSNNYERAHPENEAGMGRLDNNDSTPTDAPDRMEETALNRQNPRQINAHDTDDRRCTQPEHPEQPEQSMKEEELEGWDMAPTDIKNPRFQRHPRHEGKGGTP